MESLERTSDAALLLHRAGKNKERSVVVGAECWVFATCSAECCGGVACSAVCAAVGVTCSSVCAAVAYCAGDLRRLMACLE